MAHDQQDAQNPDQETSQRCTYVPPLDQHASHQSYQGITLNDQSRMIAGNVYGDVHINDVDYKSQLVYLNLALACAKF